MTVHVWQCILYVLAVVLFVVAAFVPAVAPNGGSRVNLALLGFAAFVLAFALPTLAA